ncbi:hypothetical protein, partial [Phocaeicola sp.]|uniref:hypothetical protein n=1 Tax=Phocaeicola sp. TaxID=2773926 RepID=UPI0023D1E90A
PTEEGRNDYPWQALLRNHIYRYTVTGIDAFSANITLNVLDWEQGEELTWDYNDNIGITGLDRLTWMEGTYQNLNDANAHLILLQDISVAAECKFRISTPKNASWHASLVYASGEKDAFMFVDEAGKEIAQPGGTIDGETVVALRIKAKGSPGQENNTARLQIAVTLPNGRTMNADVLNGKYGNNKYFTIVQNANL